MPPSFKHSVRCSILAFCVSLLAACSTYMPSSTPVESQTKTIDSVAGIPELDLITLQRNQKGRFEVVSQDEKLSFNLDPEVTSARFGTPSNIGSTLLLPIHITTQHCQNRMAAYLIEDAVVKSFEYLGGNCAVPITETNQPNWRAQQKVSGSHLHNWSFDGQQIHKQTQALSRPAAPVQRPTTAPTSKPAPVKTSSPAAPAQDKAQKPHINLMD